MLTGGLGLGTLHREANGRAELGPVFQMLVVAGQQILLLLVALGCGFGDQSAGYLSLSLIPPLLP